MDLKDFPYRMTLASQIIPLVSEEKDKYLSQASLKEIQKFIPDLPNNSVDLLPFAAQGFNINRANKNDDGIDTETALSIYKDFIYKYLDIEHSRARLVGVILNANLTEFTTNKLITEKEVGDFEKPFNVVLGGVIWRIINPKLADLIEEGSDPDSDYYQKFSLSWELGFKEFNIGILKDESPNIEGAEIITGEEVDKFKKYLKAFGGSGVYKDKKIIRMPAGKVISLGAAITEKPAAFVKGIAVASSTEDNFSEEQKHLPESKEEYPNDKSFSLNDHNCNIDDTVKSDKDIEDKVKSLISSLEELKNGDINKDEFKNKTGVEILFAKSLVNYFIKNKNNISHSSNLCVNVSENNMKISKIEDITDESLKQCNASVITSFIKEELTKGSQKWEAEKKEKENALASIEKTNEQLKSMQATLDEMSKKTQDREKLDNFNARMTEVDASYDLDADVKAALVDEIKALVSDEDFTKWKAKASIILKAYAKKKGKSKSEKDSEEQSKEYRETNMNAKKGKKDEKAEASNQIGEDNKGPGQDGNVEDKDPGTDSDNQFEDRDGDKVDPTNGENNGEHPNEIGKDNWNKGSKASAKTKSVEFDNGADGSVIDDALDNAEKEKINITNTSTSKIKKQTLKEKYQGAFASENFIVNGKTLAITENK